MAPPYNSNLPPINNAFTNLFYWPNTNGKIPGDYLTKPLSMNQTWKTNALSQGAYTLKLEAIASQEYLHWAFDWKIYLHSGQSKILVFEKSELCPEDPGTVPNAVCHSGLPQSAIITKIGSTTTSVNGLTETTVNVSTGDALEIEFIAVHEAKRAYTAIQFGLYNSGQESIPFPNFSSGLKENIYKAAIECTNNFSKTFIDHASSIFDYETILNNCEL